MILLGLLLFMLIGLMGVNSLLFPIVFLESFQIPNWSIGLMTLALLTWLLKD
jgi:hypothetical protein